jgi:tyrosinase
MAGSMVYRLPVGATNQDYMTRFRESMGKIQQYPYADKRSFGMIGGFHGIPSEFCWHHQFNQHDPRPLRLFLPWHRAYLWWLEQDLQDEVDETAIPWWDWTDIRKIPDAFSTAQVDGQHNPLFNFDMSGVPGAPDRVTARSPGGPPPLPTHAQIQAVLNIPDWANFSDQLQSYHDNVHVWSGGDMGSVSTAGFDPVFYAHHCNIDRIWYEWQKRHGINNIPQALLDVTLVPFHKTVRQVLNVEDLGYEYARSVAPIDVYKRKKKKKGRKK